jgi:hypothetical protein
VGWRLDPWEVREFIGYLVIRHPYPSESYAAAPSFGALVVARTR